MIEETVKNIVSGASKATQTIKAVNNIEDVRQALGRIAYVTITRKADVHFLPNLIASLPHYYADIVVVYTDCEDADDLPKLEAFDRLAAGGKKVRHIPAGLLSEGFAFDRAKNYAIAQVENGDWVFVLDSDERLLMHQMTDLAELVAGLPDDAGGIRTSTVEASFIGGEFRQSIHWRTNLIRRDPLIEYRGAVHETPVESIIEAGLLIYESPLLVHHVGYHGNAKRYIQKLERNLALLEREAEAGKLDARSAGYLEQTKADLLDIKQKRSENG